MSSDKTEAPSQQKLKKAREKGQIPRAREFTSAIVLVCCVVYYFFGVQSLYELISEVFNRSFIFNVKNLEDSSQMMRLVGKSLLLIGSFFFPLLIIKFIFVFFSSNVLGGLNMNFSKIAPSFNKINLLEGLKRIFSTNSIVEFFKNIVKISTCFGILYYILDSNILKISTMVRTSFHGVISLFTGYMAEVLILLVGVTVIFAIMDAPYQLFTFTKQMKMSKQELKDEYKEAEGNPETKSKLKQIRTQMSKSSVAKKVPDADLVLMNPTHYAVALKYDQAKADAPFVIAKGTDEIALYIKGLAMKNKVEVIELPELTRSIYYTTSLNQMIPSQLYGAIADLLRYIQELKRYKSGVGAKPPEPKKMTIPENLRY